MRQYGWILWILAFLLPCPVEPAAAQEVGIKDIVVTNSDTDLLLYLKVVDAFTPEIVKGAQSGLPVTFTYQVRLVMERSAWTDKEIYSGTVDHTMLYDSLKKDYTLTFSERPGKRITTHSLDEAQAMMTELAGFKVVPLDRLVPDRRYVLEVRVTLAKKSLPFNFDYLIPFGNFWDFSTDWYSVSFRY